VGERAALRQDPAGEEVPGDLRRRERERDIEQELVLAGSREVVEERPRLDRLKVTGYCLWVPGLVSRMS
jgi:predicted alpha-1,6-mannanase (GH76 family)